MNSNRLQSRLNTEFVAAGEEVFEQGDDPDHFYIIASGEVRVTRLEKEERRDLPGQF